MILPSSVGGSTTEQVGFFNLTARLLANWISDELDGRWTTTSPDWGEIGQILVFLTPDRIPSRYVCVPLTDDWTALLNNTPLGTDVGILPSLAARKLGVRTIRALCTADTDPSPARVLEVFGNDGSAPLRLRRSIIAAKDGARWIFEQSGDPFDFEMIEMYLLRRKADRFPRSLLIKYLTELGVEVERRPQWERSIAITKAP